LSKSTFGLRRAGLATLAVTLTLGGAFVAAPAQADWALAGGEIGLVDTSANTPGAAGDVTTGATMVQPGVAGQKLGDVRLLIPNTFKNGDTIDLAIFDRSAGTTNGQINADAAHKLGFSGTPKVTVDSTPYESATHIGPTADSSKSTEGSGAEAAKPWDKSSPAVKPSTPPVLTTTLVQSSRANNLATDIVRLTVNGVQAAGDSDADWVVTVSDLLADLGPAVSPGELRVVPFAYNGAPSTTFTNASPLFAGNLADDPTTPGVAGDPVVNTYTVPAYVAPVTFNVGAPNNILADGTTQKIGDIAIAETNNYSLQDGLYRINVTGAEVRNDPQDAPIKVTTSGAAKDETVEITDAGPGFIEFEVDGASNTSKVSFTLSGILLRANRQGPISYTLNGGSIDGNGNHSFLVTAGDSLEIPEGYAGNGSDGKGVEADSAFVTAGTPAVADDPATPEDESVAAVPGGDVNQTDIKAPGFSVSALATSLEKRIGGGDRYETAAKIALNNGSNDYVVLASGENFPDALSSGYLANQIGGGSILLTRQASIPQPTLSAMRELGTRTVFVVGGPAAISEKVANQLRNTPQYYEGGRETIGQGKLHVVRLAGDNRYETNKKVNEYAAAMFQQANPVGRTNIEFGEASKLTALVATGEGFADALAAGPATAGSSRGNLPLILTRGASLSPEAGSQMKSLGIEQAVVVGGEDVVTPGVASAIAGLGADIHRIAGADRYATAAAVADWIIAPEDATPSTDGGLGFDEYCDFWNDSYEDCEQGAYLATGEKYADALAGAPLAGGSGSPLLLTRSNSLSAPTEAWLKKVAADYNRVVALGLGAAVSPAVLDAANAAVSAK
jgi:putative cell wall-binding protein